MKQLVEDKENDITIRKEVFRHVEAELYAYPFRKREIERLREEILHPHAPAEENIGGGKSNLPGDPTAKKAIRLASHAKLVHMERVADAIEEAYDRLPEVKKELIQVKYWTKPQRLTTVGICGELGISESTYKRWRRQFVGDVAKILGW